MRGFFALYLVASVTLSVIPARSEENKQTSYDSNISSEDKSCYAVNRAYERMNKSGRWTSNIYELYPNGNTNFYLQMRVIDRNFFQKTEHEPWKSYLRQPIHLTIDSTGLPIFSACRYQGVETMKGGPALRYAAAWRRNGWEASADIWISRASGKIVQTVSRFRQGMGECRFPIALQTMDYDRMQAIEPVNTKE